MSQPAQLSAAEIDERFHITSRTAVQFTLAAFARSHESFSVQFAAGQETFLTMLLAVQPEKARLVFDCSGSAETNRRFLASTHNIFHGQPGGIPVQFATGAAVEIAYQDDKAFAVALPQALIRLQRREHFRIETPRAAPLTFFGRLPGGELLTLPAQDISVSGICLNADSVPEGLATEQVLTNCHFALPGETRDLFFSATVRRIVEQTRPNGTRYWQLGLQFNQLSTGDENRIQRYIARLERERCA